MVDIPLDKNYLRKHYPDKYKELEKNETFSSKSQSKDEYIKHHSKAETTEPKFDPRTDEFQRFYCGEIELPTEYDKYIHLPKSFGPREFEMSEMARLAKISSYVAMHLKRWEQEKVSGSIEHAYRVWLHPFTNRVKQIEPYCERMKPLLALRMSTIKDNFEVRYDNLLSVAEKTEEKRDRNFHEALEEFKIATIFLCDTVQMIRNEAVVALVRFAQSNSGEAGDADKQLETGQNTTVVKGWRGIWACFKKMIEKGLQIFTKSFWDAFFEKYGPPSKQ